jgi:hypothetical protein
MRQSKFDKINARLDRAEFALEALQKKVVLEELPFSKRLTLDHDYGRYGSGGTPLRQIYSRSKWNDA